MTLPLRLDLWLPPLVLMGVIFVLSNQPDLGTDLGVIDLIGRKIVHALEYALLCFLWWRALREVIAGRAALVTAFCVTVAYAASDEFHQSFVDGRHGTPVDVLIDATGAGLAAFAITRMRARSAA